MHNVFETNKNHFKWEQKFQIATEWSSVEHPTALSN